MGGNKNSTKEKFLANCWLVWLLTLLSFRLVSTLVTILGKTSNWCFTFAFLKRTSLCNHLLSLIRHNSLLISHIGFAIIAYHSDKPRRFCQKSYSFSAQFAAIIQAQAISQWKHFASTVLLEKGIKLQVNFLPTNLNLSWEGIGSFLQ